MKNSRRDSRYDARHDFEYDSHYDSNHDIDYDPDHDQDPPHEPRSRGMAFLRAFTITISTTLLIISALLFAWAIFVQPPTIPPQPNPNPATSPDRKPGFYTFLIFGYDIGLRPDTIMVAAYDAYNQHAYIVSIPRDTRVLSQRGPRRINASYPSGRLHGDGHADGVNQLKQELQTLIGFRPDFYVSLHEDVFVVIVDAVGGVYIDVPFHMHYRDPYQDLYINIQEGHQRLDGENALHFVRFRYHYDRRGAISNHLRMQHQHQLIDALVHELKTPATILRIPQFIRAYMGYMNTDVPLGSLLWLGQQFVLDDITLITYNYPVTSVRSTAWYDIPNGREALALINRTINPFVQDITMDMLELVQ